MAVTFEKPNRQPLYQQAAQRLRQQVEAGELVPGSRLPSMRELSKQWGINHLTVRQAMQTLVDEGILISERGRGTFVREAPAQQRVALILANLGHETSAKYSQGIREVMQAHNYEVTIFDSHGEYEAELDNIDRFRRYELSGAIIYSTGSPPAVREILRLILDDVPVVLLDRVLRDIPAWYVASDNIHGGYLATDHLLKRGKRVAFCSDLADSATRDRYEGYRQALISRGVTPDPALLAEVGSDDDTRLAVRELLKRAEDLDGIFFGNDLRALEGLQELHQLGYKVPGDIAVVGFDDAQLAPLASPPLTSVRQDKEKMGRLAAELLIEQCKASERVRQQGKHHVLPVELIVRDSA